MLRLLALFILVCPLAMAQKTVTGPEGDCGFSELHPAEIVHYVQRDVVSKASPQYPLAAKARGVTGTVRVRILINSLGLVERTCPEFIANEDRPDRSLVVAAEASALQWKFAPHFGFSTDKGLQFKYVQDVLIFDFTLDSPVKGRVADPSSQHPKFIHAE
jgi:Gram-negative bacterial TonB protein C-terminal